MNPRGILAAVVISLTAVMGGSVAYAQAVSGAINGYITDPSDAPIAGASVAIVNEHTGVRTKASASSTGFYNAINLVPGQYTVSAEQPGFAKVTRQHVNLEVDASVRVDLKLAIGSVAESVTVAADAELLQSEKVDVSQTIGEQQIQSLPIIGRNLTQFYITVPGAMPDSFQMGSGENPAGGLRTYVNGTWSGSQEFVLDGITDRSYGFSGIQLVVPPPDSVQELKITTADYDPEFGSTSGMVAQYVTKFGTNDLHGSVFYYNRNNYTFAADPLTQKIAGTGKNGTGTGVAPFNWNQGGFSLGGPIKKNKLFLFGDYQFGRTIQGASIITTVPNSAFTSGNFSQVSNRIYDPLTGNADGSGRTAFAGNIVPASRFNPVSKNLMALLPQANINQGTDNNYVGDVKEKFNQNNVDTRGDWNINDANKFFIRYSYYSSYLDNPPLFGAIADGPSQGGLSPEKANSSSHLGALNFTHTFSSSLLTELRAGYARFNLNALQYDSALQTNTKVGIQGINTGQAITGGLAGIGVGGPVGGWSMGIQSGVGIPRFDTENTYEYVNNWSKMSRSHQLRWGVDFRRYQFDFQSVNASSRGNYSFCQTATGDANTPNSGLGMATFLLGGTCSFDRAIFTGEPAERQTSVGLYLQDIWRINSKLTFNYGLRWDKVTPVRSPYKGGLANFDFSTGYILLSGMGAVSDSANVNTPNNDFAPRLGVAYKLTRNTVVRAGFGRSFFSSGYDATFYHLTSGYPIVTQQSVTQPNLYSTVFSLDQLPPSGQAPSLPSNGLLLAPDGVTLKSRESNWKTETMDAWNLTIEQSLGHGAILSAAYLGNKGTHLSLGENLNTANVGAGSLLSRRPYYVKYGLTQGVSMECNCSDSNYNALQVVFQKQLSNWYTVNSNISWSKSLGYDFNWSDNPYNRKLVYGVGGGTISANTDRAVVWITSHTINLPYGPGRPFGANVTGVRKFLLAGWAFSGITSVETGLAYTPVLSSSASLNADFTQRPNLVSGVSSSNVVGGKNAAHWYNPAAFSVPVCCSFGMASVGSLRGPGFINADWALSKNFAFSSFLNRESTKVEFRAESFNTWNNTNLSLPNASVDTSSAGQITSLQGTMRRMEFGVHIIW